LGSNNSGRGVGGSMIHYAGYTPRFHPSDFRIRTNDGVGADWPIAYSDLKPYYEAIEGELPVSGEQWPWGDPHSYPYSPHPVSGNGELFQRGALTSGITAKVGPVAILSGRFGNRPHCIYRGFCLQGCKVNAKASPLITHIPDALAHGAEVRPDSMVTRVEIDERTGRATGVHYWRDGVEHFQRAKTVALAGYSIETPRLLLNSTSQRFPDGLCNDFDQVGRYLMVQGAPQTAGRFDSEVRMWKGPPPEVSSEQFYETDSSKPYKRGFSIQTVSPLPITWAEHVMAQGHWGADFRNYMTDYVHWACLGALCEFLPQPDNRVTLATEKDRHGMPIARFDYSQCDNDRALLKAAREVMERILTSAGADEVITIDRNAHLVGGARMATNENEGVVDADCRSFAVPNLLIVDGSVLPTQGSANPALTIMANAARAADRLLETTKGR
ncbi:MAG: GMC family oxidoreductase, partial [Lacisediminihabitans sp.]